MFPRGFRLGACCLTILIYMFKECLRVRCDHATPTFPDFKGHRFTGAKGIRLQEKRHTFTGERHRFTGEKGIRLQERGIRLQERGSCVVDIHSGTGIP